MTETAHETQVELEVGYASGKSVPRKEDGRLSRAGVFADDVKRHAGVRIRPLAVRPRADRSAASAAEALDGVYGTLTPDDVAQPDRSVFELTTPPGSEIKGLALVVGRVRHIGGRWSPWSPRRGSAPGDPSTWGGRVMSRWT